MSEDNETVQDDGFEWMIVEIFGHRRHFGKGMEVERFGSKMLRIDVPSVKWSEPTAEQPSPQPLVESWVTHFYGGAAIFSNTLTDEATVLRCNARTNPPAQLLPARQEDEDDDLDDDGRPF